MPANPPKKEKRVRKKAEPFIWSFEVLSSTFYLSLFGIFLGTVCALSGRYVNYFFHYLIYPFALFGQLMSIKAQLKIQKVDEKLRKYYALSLSLMVLIESFFIWKFLLVPNFYQFLLMFGVAANGLAFIGYLRGKDRVQKLGISVNHKVHSKLTVSSPFLWFATFLALTLLLPVLGIDSRNFIHFSLAPFLSVLSALNIGFVSGFIKDSVAFELKR